MKTKTFSNQVAIGYLLECVFLFIKKIEGANNEKVFWIVLQAKRQDAIK